MYAPARETVRTSSCTVSSGPIQWRWREVRHFDERRERPLAPQTNAYPEEEQRILANAPPYLRVIDTPIGSMNGTSVLDNASKRVWICLCLALRIQSAIRVIAVGLLIRRGYQFCSHVCSVFFARRDRGVGIRDLARPSIRLVPQRLPAWASQPTRDS
jgi:hypothetical protein